MNLACQAVLFDMDGVLTDSTVSAERAWTQWAHEFGVDPEQVLRGLHGRRATDTVRMHVPASAHAGALRRINEIEVADAGSTAPIPGARELVDSLPGNWAVVTSAPPELLTVRLAAVGIPLPSVVINGDDVTHGKPDPEGYLKAAGKLGLPIGECVVFEDSGNGVAAGLAAEAASVVGVGAEALHTPAPVVVPDLRAVQWTGRGLRVTAALRRPSA
ncbi:HAD-IA family hydrolase [Lentzea sp. NBC_00516]|uniref:HAD-IA family hydrolase n=1 Tax=Lentzea sp. NBC_00516 TaxID=2903582 RepID=UPI002E7FE2AE|nr:HAD-IA family hydrolase [Lentzea sp. NBC_00516]WUD27876.1 HAD-IA family hydrolase [Lentzea sp. NBC_00516]